MPRTIRTVCDKESQKFRHVGMLDIIFWTKNFNDFTGIYELIWFYTNDFNYSAVCLCTFAFDREYNLRVHPWKWEYRLIVNGNGYKTVWFDNSQQSRLNINTTRQLKWFISNFVSKFNWKSFAKWFHNLYTCQNKNSEVGQFDSSGSFSVNRSIPNIWMQHRRQRIN